MNTILFSILLVFNLNASIGKPENPATGSVTIEINGLTSDKGEVLVALYNNKEHFPDKGDKAVANGKAVIIKGKATLTFKGLPYGKYAAAILHDENLNHQMDFNAVGIPMEGYGFSNNAKGLIGAPSFNKAAFGIDSANRKISIKQHTFK